MFSYFFTSLFFFSISFGELFIRKKEFTFSPLSFYKFFYILFVFFMQNHNLPLFAIFLCCSRAILILKNCKNVKNWIKYFIPSSFFTIFQKIERLVSLIETFPFDYRFTSFIIFFFRDTHILKIW